MPKADETMLADEHTPIDSHEAGALLAGRYELRGLLGVGGMGSVYRAWDRELDDLVALKMLRHGSIHAAGLARFRKEVKLARTVTHRNVARTFDIGEDRDERFLTMELIDGVSLEVVIAERAPLALADARMILIQIAEGLAAAHAVNVVHRDLKPANVMVEPGGRVVVTDFGLARRSEAGSETIGVLGQVLGTPAYMAPEQVAGMVDIDARADVYAFGLIAHELLLGRPGFRGGSALQVAAARLYEPPPDFAGVASPLRELLRRCVARDQDERFAHAAELLPGLREAGSSISGFELQLDAPRSRETRVAVLPFAQGRSAGEELLEGISEDLADVLSMTPGIRVRHSALRSDRALEDPIAVGRDVGVDVVVIGSVRRIGEQLRVNVRVLGTADGYQLWAGRFDRKLEQALALNDEVAAAVAEVLTAEAPKPRHGPTNPRAIEYYLLARKLAADNFMTRERPHLEPLARAISLAPDDPMLIGLWVYSSMAGRNFEPIEVAPEIAAATERLIARAPDLVGTHLARAAVQVYGRDDRAGAIEWLRRGLLLAPNHIDLLYLLGAGNYEAGRIEQAGALYRRGLWSDSTPPWLRVSAAHVLGLQGRWSELIELLDANDSEGWVRPRNIALARAQVWAGRELGPVVIDDGEPNIVAVARLQARRIQASVSLAELEAGYQQQQRVVPRNSRARRLLGQMWTELFVSVDALDHAAAAVVQVVADGLTDAAWFDHLALLDPLRGRADFEQARAIAGQRAAAIAAALDAPLG